MYSYKNKSWTFFQPFNHPLNARLTSQDLIIQTCVATTEAKLTYLIFDNEANSNSIH